VTCGSAGTGPEVRIRQVALVAGDLDAVAAELRHVLGLDEPFRDPGVAEFGLRNVVFALGNQFLEVVSPVREDATAARYLARRGGDAGYMVILQSADLVADRARLATLGVRVVWQVELPDVATVHLHPRDLGGAIVSLDQPVPPVSWRWGGPGWEERGARSDARAITGVELRSEEPEALALRWSAALGVAAPEHAGGAWRVALEGGALSFRALEDEGGEGIHALRLVVRDADATRRRARERGCVDARGRVWVGGVVLEAHDGGRVREGRGTRSGNGAE